MSTYCRDTSAAAQQQCIVYGIAVLYTGRETRYGLPLPVFVTIDAANTTMLGAGRAAATQSNSAIR